MEHAAAGRLLVVAQIRLQLAWRQRVSERDPRAARIEIDRQCTTHGLGYAARIRVELRRDAEFTALRIEQHAGERAARSEVVVDELEARAAVHVRRLRIEIDAPASQ